MSLDRGPCRGRARRGTVASASSSWRWRVGPRARSGTRCSSGRAEEGTIGGGALENQAVAEARRLLRRRPRPRAPSPWARRSANAAAAGHAGLGKVDAGSRPRRPLRPVLGDAPASPPGRPALLAMAGWSRPSPSPAARSGSGRGSCGPGARPGSRPLARRAITWIDLGLTDSRDGAARRHPPPGRRAPARSPRAAGGRPRHRHAPTRWTSNLPCAPAAGTRRRPDRLGHQVCAVPQRCFDAGPDPRPNVAHCLPDRRPARASTPKPLPSA